MALDRHALLERNLDRQIAWIRASDAKISMLLPINTAMLALLAAQLGQAHTTPTHWVLAIAASVPSLVSFASSVRAAMPRLRRSGESLLYFTDVAERTPEAFRDSVRGLSDDGHFEDLAGVVHFSAATAREKMHHVRNAYLALLVALPFWIAALYLLNAR